MMYVSQSARDAQRSGYGGHGYPAYLEAAAQDRYDYFRRLGMFDRAAEVFTRNLGMALAGNEGFLMSKRAQERAEFLGDIITTAVEGGTGYWAQVSQYQYEYDGEIRVCVGRRHGDEPRATLHDMEDGKTFELTLDAIARGIGIIARGQCKHLSEGARKLVVQASRTNDAGEIDADGADWITQAACFGELVYG